MATRNCFDLALARYSAPSALMQTAYTALRSRCLRYFLFASAILTALLESG
jgi:hypothetical protein